ncbi:MAG TPA: hypothetical protein PKV40_07375 [Candidatus Kapabacteria bacterium]|nr:hypothetical protein [Candidatus Kapabacteria bacterium]HRT67806.1 hypothetical protein [Bacteroidota bacterium]
MLEWYRCTGGKWCELEKLNVEHPAVRNTNGIYILWIDEDNHRKIIRIGQGNIYQEIIKLKNELVIKAFETHGLKITWAEVPLIRRPGVLIYFINTLNPMMLGGKPPRAIPIKENLPWEE